MFRLIAQIAIYGDSESLQAIAASGYVPNGTLTQVGQKRKNPDRDFWIYCSPWYQFRDDDFDLGIRGFLNSHHSVHKVLTPLSAGIRHAMLIISPVGQNAGHEFSCLLSKDTLRILVNMHLDLEISPSQVMPQFPYWGK